MGTVIDMRAWRREREPRHRQVARLELAMERVDAAAQGMQRSRAPRWLSDGVRRARELLHEGDVGGAADLTESLAERLEHRGVG